MTTITHSRGEALPALKPGAEFVMYGESWRYGGTAEYTQPAGMYVPAGVTPCIAANAVHMEAVTSVCNVWERTALAPGAKDDGVGTMDDDEMVEQEFSYSADDVEEI